MLSQHCMFTCEHFLWFANIRTNKISRFWGIALQLKNRHFYNSNISLRRLLTLPEKAFTAPIHPLTNLAIYLVYHIHHQ